MPQRIRLAFEVNGNPVEVEAWPLERLLDILRDHLHLTGTKEGCGEGECGACAVLLDDELVNSCLVPAAQLEGVRVTTIEALAHSGELDSLQRAFLEAGAVQCGFCTPGMVLAAARLLHDNPRPSDDDIRRALAGNLCRCTGYARVVAAVKQASQP